MPRVILLTTMWSIVRTDVATQREKELKETFWSDLVLKGCKTKRFGDTHESAWEIIEGSKVQSQDSPASSAQVLISKQMVDKRMSLKATAAGITLNRHLQKLKKDQRLADRKFRDLATEWQDDAVSKQLDERKAQLEDKISLVNDQLQAAKRGWFQSLFEGPPAVSSSFTPLSPFLSPLQDVPMVPGFL